MSDDQDTQDLEKQASGATALTIVRLKNGAMYRCTERPERVSAREYRLVMASTEIPGAVASVEIGLDQVLSIEHHDVYHEFSTEMGPGSYVPEEKPASEQFLANLLGAPEVNDLLMRRLGIGGAGDAAPAEMDAAPPAAAMTGRDQAFLRATFDRNPITAGGDFVRALAVLPVERFRPETYVLGEAPGIFKVCYLGGWEGDVEAWPRCRGFLLNVAMDYGFVELAHGHGTCLPAVLSPYYWIEYKYDPETAYGEDTDSEDSEPCGS